MTAFFEGTRPGDLPAIAKKLRERDPHYAAVKALAGLH